MLSTKTIFDERGLRSLKEMHTGRQVPGPAQFKNAQERETEYVSTAFCGEQLRVLSPFLHRFHYLPLHTNNLGLSVSTVKMEAKRDRRVVKTDVK